MEIGDVKSGDLHDSGERKRLLDDAANVEDLEHAERMRTGSPHPLPHLNAGSQRVVAPQGGMLKPKAERKKPRNAFKRVAPARVTFDVEVLQVHFGHGSVLDVILNCYR